MLPPHFTEAAKKLFVMDARKFFISMKRRHLTDQIKLNFFYTSLNLLRVFPVILAIAVTTAVYNDQIITAEV